MQGLSPCGAKYHPLPHPTAVECLDTVSQLLVVYYKYVPTLFALYLVISDSTSRPSLVVKISVVRKNIEPTNIQ